MPQKDGCAALAGVGPGCEASAAWGQAYASYRGHGSLRAAVSGTSNGLSERTSRVVDGTTWSCIRALESDV
ncbi:predicted protein [Pyrenophora tritici-repentis Pt-1C-BFP]|uniref:Uncharacterized protein n=1 Tax=Pyrenophora tritici-repentis (strain Pt-1C-BFP) TaxID=426418 RepID=B2W3W0_PYRTR|nr:uncharacterized protein PTRG_05160 [Pyrenophora tritici-repentis Pt-1C-BFP]EDU48067.1 predicted protein [Pyrenophora tritici-repentis Pt-1C-BFP]